MLGVGDLSISSLVCALILVSTNARHRLPQRGCFLPWEYSTH